MNKQVTVILLCLISLMANAKDVKDAKDDQQAIEQTDMETKSDKSTYAKDNLKSDMAVAFGEKPAERQTSEMEFAAWGMKLNERLLASEDDFAQAITLAKMLSGVRTAQMMAKLHNKEDQLDVLNDLSYQPIADLVNQLIGKPELSAATFDILTSICFNPEMQDYCHANVLLEKRMQQDTANLQAYLRPFEMAVKANNAKTMQQLMQLMAASQHSSTPLGATAYVNSLIDQFITNNPIPQSAVDNMIIDYQQLSGLSVEKKAQLDQLMPKYMPTYIKFSYNYLNDVPPYRTILDYCQTNMAAIGHCRDIAEIMIEKSNTMIDKGVGYSLLIATYELERNQAGMDVAQQLNDKFRQSYECIRDLAHDKYFIDNYFDPDYQKINFSSNDEFETLIQLAELRYRNIKAQGDEAAVNPDTCFNGN